MKNTAFTRAQHDFLRGDYGRAIMGFGTALETGMDAARVHLPLGLAYFRNHDFMEAVAEFSRVLELRPDDDQVLFLRGMARFNAGDEAGAVSDLTAALDANPNRVAAYVGRSLANRSRFAIELIQAVRAAVGEGFPIIFRFSQWKQQDYEVKLAQDPKALEAWLGALVDAGADILHCSQRRFWEPEFEGSDLNFAGWAKKLTGVPTITVGSVGLSGEFIAAFAGEGSKPASLEELERRLDRGDFDLVGVGRALLQDPEWVVKIREGRTSELKNFEREALAKLY